ncbi:alkaline phosphatase [Micromonospora sp. WP24]|uniref:alkaline phosphatase D family protein n=1 Tax=Micromonospora sp. WP24 TaxID=2604469 RepID=UPI0011D3E5E2|nr:alkaline phosphatase D family protein [Micromonospora sp. WP24]TYB91318.1 alkaline phosphatase [Micromonospora sp. WP24]
MINRPSFAKLPELDRRRLLQIAGGGALGLAFGLALPTPADAHGSGGFAYPFTNGVASGDPLEDRVVLWTRIAPDPLAPNGGLNPDARVRVDWQVAQDERFHKVVADGTVVTSPDTSHTVHVDVSGLKAGHQYFYRFRAGGHISETGRTWTAPPTHSMRPLRFAVASCQNWRAGYFQTMRDAVDQGAELMMFVGDYIYEYAVEQLPVGRLIDPNLPAEVVPTTVTLDQYRLRYALYKTDPDLLLAHQAMPWILTWDDHEVANDYESWKTPDPLRRAAAYRAYWEYMPIRWPQAPAGADARLYRRFRYGQLAQIDVLDTRQYRAPMAMNGGTLTDDGPRRDPSMVLLGAEQEQWFTRGLGAVPARWNIAAQQILMTRLNTAADPEKPATFSAGTWDGYQAGQQRFFDTVAAAEKQGSVRNFVVMSGDVHCSYISDLPRSTLDPTAGIIGAEFTSTSISSAQDFDPKANEARQVRRRVNPTLKWADLHCGYVLADLTADRMAVDIRVVDKVSVHDDPVFTGASFVVEDRVAGVTAV